MTTKESFEAWYDDEEITPLPDDYTILGKRYLYMGWCAATTEANKRRVELESEVAELKVDINEEIQTLRAKVASAEVLVGALREAKLALLSGVLTYESVRTIEKAIAKYNKLIGVKHD